MTRSTIQHTKKIMQTTTSKSTFVTALGAVTLASLLAACGGGGGSDAPASVLPTSNLQGIWSAGTLGSETASMVVLSNGASWLLVNHAPVQLITSVLKGTLTGYDGAGIEYTSGSTPAPAAVSYAASVVPKQTLTGNVTQSGQIRAFKFSYDARYEVAALQSDVAGTWTGTKNAGSVAVTWAISGTGALTGSSTSGCSYGGAVAVHGAGAAPVGVFDLTLKETCNNLGVDVVKNFGGIVVLNAAKTGATFAFSTAAGTEGDFLSASKQAVQ
jgi:hypothetical protein